MNEMDFNREEKEREATRAVPVVDGPAEEPAAETPLPEEKTPGRRRRSDRYRIDAQEAENEAFAGYTSEPVFRAGNATAREVANRVQPRAPMNRRENDPVEPGSRVPPQAARMNAASRLHMAAARENRPAGRSGEDYKGYAPGKMRESDQRAAYMARKNAGPVRPESRPGFPNQQPGKRRAWIAVLLILALAVLILAGAFLIPENSTGIPAAIRQTVRGWVAALIGDKVESVSGVTGFIASGYYDAVAPTDVSISVTTSKGITDIRLTDEDGEELPTSRMVGDNMDQTLWNLTWHLEDGYEGEVRLQVLTNNGWTDTDQVLPVSIASLPTVIAESTGFPGSVDSEPPVVTVTPAPTAEPTEEPMEEPEEQSPEDAWAEDGGPSEDSGPAEETDPALPEEMDGGAEDEPRAEETEAPTLPPAKTPEPTEEPSPGPTETPKLTAKACEEADPSLITTAVIYNGNKKASEYARATKEQITMPTVGQYTRKEIGVLTFRSDAFRQNAACGKVSGAESLEIAWTADTGSIKGASQTYYGIGWVGQPAIVQWSKEVRELSDILDAKKEKKKLVEVIAAGLDGTIYFLDVADGTPTRSIIKLGYPMKGSPSVHPGGAPYMNVGQFARKMSKGTGRIGLRQYNLYSGKEMNLIDGLDTSNRRVTNAVGSFETSALMDRTSDSLITAGTNGLLYVINMGSTFDYKMGVYTQSPGTVLLKTKAKGESDADTAVEASVAMYDKYVFYADMGGILRCVDTNTMKTVWAVNTEDSVESTVALDFNTSGGLDLYTANILSKRKKGDAQVRCYDAMSGEEKWKAEFGVRKDTKNKTVSGFRASPVVGQHDLENLVYYTVNNLSEEGADALGVSENAALIALDKRTGNKIWAKGLSGIAYSSPVAVYEKSGYGWIIQCTGEGSILLMDGLTGRTISELTVEGAIEASPAVYDDMMVIGTSEKGANHLYGIRIQGGEADQEQPSDDAEE